MKERLSEVQDERALEVSKNQAVVAEPSCQKPAIRLLWQLLRVSKIVSRAFRMENSFGLKSVEELAGFFFSKGFDPFL